MRHFPLSVHGAWHKGFVGKTFSLHGIAELYTLAPWVRCLLPPHSLSQFCHGVSLITY